MSITHSGALSRSLGIVSAINKQVKLINLKGVKKISVAFDPFAENVTSTREFLHLVTIPRVSQTNPKCAVKTDVLCDRKPAEITFSLIDSAQEIAKVKEIKLISQTLSTLELLQLCNKHITPLAPLEDTTPRILTKAEKQKATAGAKKPLKKK